MSIHILDDDSLLGIFNLYRPAIFDGDEDVHIHIAGGKKWDRERWWYQLAQVCRRWRNLILGSASHLGLCLVCTYGTPVADMLSHSPSLPLIIDYFNGYRDITAEDEEGIITALKQHHRVRRIRLCMPILKLQKLIMSIDDEYPVLEYLVMEPPLEDKCSALVFPKTLQAPHLRHASLIGFVFPTESRLLTTAVGLVTLCLHMEHPSAYFQPNTLLQWVSSMPQLETLLIFFLFPPNRDAELQLMHTPITTHVTLPNLRSFGFQGVSSYMEAVVRWIITPRLERLAIRFFEQLTFSVPRLLQFVNTTRTLRFDSATFNFSREKVYTRVYLREEAEMFGLFIKVYCWRLDWQVSSVVQIFNSLNQISSKVEHLILDTVHSRSSEDHNEVDRIEWRSFLRLFSNVKTLRVRVDDEFVKELSRCLRLDDEEHPLELLPELQELTYSGSGDTGDVFTPFIDARQNAGRPVTLVRDSPSDSALS